MADDRLVCGLSASMVSTKADMVVPRSRAISCKPFQNASSRLTLVLRLQRLTERLTTVDRMTAPQLAFKRRDGSILSVERQCPSMLNGLSGADTHENTSR